jgi:DNA end-binding protein Ku
LIASLSAEWDPGQFRDEYRDRVLDLIERKAAGEEISVQPQAEEPAAAPDLMAALEASLAAVGKAEKEAPAPRRKRTPAKASGDGRGAAKKRPAKARR